MISWFLEQSSGGTCKNRNERRRIEKPNKGPAEINACSSFLLSVFRRINVWAEAGRLIISKVQETEGKRKYTILALIARSDSPAFASMLRGRWSRFRSWLGLLNCYRKKCLISIRPASSFKHLLRPYLIVFSVFQPVQMQNAGRLSSRTAHLYSAVGCTLVVEFDASSSLATASFNVSVATASHFLKIGISLKICFIFMCKKIHLSEK